MYEEIKQRVEDNGWNLIHIGTNELLNKSEYSHGYWDNEPDFLDAFHRHMKIGADKTCISIRFQVRRSSAFGYLCAYVKVNNLTPHIYDFDIYKSVPEFDSEENITCGIKYSPAFEIGIDGCHLWNKVPGREDHEEAARYLSFLKCMRWQEDTEKQLLKFFESKSFDDIDNDT